MPNDISLLFDESVSFFGCNRLRKVIDLICIDVGTSLSPRSFSTNSTMKNSIFSECMEHGDVLRWINGDRWRKDLRPHRRHFLRPPLLSRLFLLQREITNEQRIDFREETPIFIFFHDQCRQMKFGHFRRTNRIESKCQERREGEDQCVQPARAHERVESRRHFFSSTARWSSFHVRPTIEILFSKEKQRQTRKKRSDVGLGRRSSPSPIAFDLGARRKFAVGRVFPLLVIESLLANRC